MTYSLERLRARISLKVFVIVVLAIGCEYTWGIKVADLILIGDVLKRLLIAHVNQNKVQ